MRMFSLLFGLISLVVLTQFVIYVIRGPVDFFIAGIIFVAFLFCAGFAVFLFKPFEDREALRRRREERAARRREDSTGGGDRDA